MYTYIILYLDGADNIVIQLVACTVKKENRKPHLPYCHVKGKATLIHFHGNVGNFWLSEA